MEQKILLIERYLDGNLDLNERKQFEEMLNTDKFLKKELRLRKRINEVIENHKMVDIKRAIKRIYNENYGFYKFMYQENNMFN